VQVEVQQSTEVEAMAKAQQRAMEIEKHELKTITKKRCAILNKATLLEKGIKIPNPKQFIWTQTKQNYDKHVERMENWRDIAKEEDRASKARLVPLFLMDWKHQWPMSC